MLGAAPFECKLGIVMPLGTVAFRVNYPLDDSPIPSVKIITNRLLGVRIQTLKELLDLDAQPPSQ